jgi:type I restriction enzyme S subunit
MQAISGTSLFDADASAAGAAEQLARLQAKQPRKYAELRATAEMFPSTMQESELGEIPEGWDIQQIGEILDRLKPKKRYTKKQVTPTGQTPVFEQGSDILLGFHNGIPVFIATSEDPAFIFGDHTCIIHLSCQNFDVSQNVIPLKGKVRSTMWTYYALQGKQTFQDYRRHWAELVVKPVIYPPNALCKQFSETINSSIRLKEQLDQEAKSLSEIRDLLLPKLLSGQLSVSGTANCVPEVEEVTDV